MMSGEVSKAAVLLLVLFTVVENPAKVFGQVNGYAKKYQVNLDHDPYVRWDAVAEDYGAMVTDYLKIIRKYIPASVVPILLKLVDRMDDYFDPEFISEIKGIAHVTKSDPGELLILNIAYEVTVFCTSIVAQDSQGRIWHARNLDYSNKDILRNLTIEVEFTKNNKTLYRGTTFAGYVGLLTGQRLNDFTISIDERRTNSPLWENAIIAIMDKNAILIGRAVRMALEKQPAYDYAVKYLCEKDTIAPIYYIVGGRSANEGCVITHARKGVDDVWKMNTTVGRWYLVETNYDHWKPPPADDDRRDAAIKLMNLTGMNNISAESMRKVLSTPPMHNSHTVYTTVMSAGASPSYYSTWIW